MARSRLGAGARVRGPPSAWPSRSPSSSPCATPGDAQDLTGLAELAVHGLAEADARALLESVIAGPLDERVRDRIVAETHGNPLALLELPRGMTAAGLAGGFGLPDAPVAVESDRGELPAAS